MKINTVTLEIEYKLASFLSSTFSCIPAGNKISVVTWGVFFFHTPVTEHISTDFCLYARTNFKLYNAKSLSLDDEGFCRAQLSVTTCYKLYQDLLEQQMEQRALPQFPNWWANMKIPVAGSKKHKKTKETKNLL